MSADFLTLVAPVDGSKVAKRIVKGQPAPIKLPYFHQGEEFPCENIDQLITLLETAATDGAWYVVRGRLRPGLNKSRFLRRHLGADASLLECEHNWVLIDLDKFREDVNAEDFCQDVAGYAAEARAMLPAPFRGAKCWYQATGSAGFKAGIRLRLGFWLTRPLDNLAVKAWFRDLPVDRSIYTPSQPCLIAHPILEETRDPVPNRSGVLPGLDAVEVPGVLEQGASDPIADLHIAAKRIGSAAEGERRNILNRQGYQLAFKHSEAALSDEIIRDTLSEAASKKGLPGSEIIITLTAAIRDGRAKGDKNRSGWRRELALDEDGKPIPTPANCSLILEHHDAFAGKLGLDERTQSETWLSPPPWGGDAPRYLNDADDTRIVEWFQHSQRLQVKTAWVRAGVAKAARMRPFDGVQGYLREVPAWTEGQLVDTFFIRHLGVKDTPLIRAQTRAWFIQMYRRAFSESHAPVRADYMIVLSGETGIGKSTTLQALVPEPRYFLDNLPDLRDKDSVLYMAKTWLVELAEMTQKKADRDVFKAFITRTVDTIRPPYGRVSVEIPRRSVLVGTTNECVFLSDPTGNRRFWVMYCTKRANPAEVAAERDQLWAEVQVYAEAGEPAYLSDELEKQAAQEQDGARQESPVEDMLRAALSIPAQKGVQYELGQLDEHGCLKWLRWVDIQAMLDIEVHKMAGQVSDALRALEWRSAKTPNGRRWFRPETWKYDISVTNRITQHL